MKKRSFKTEYCHGLRIGIPIAIGYFVVALSLGLNASVAGFSILQAGFCSAFCLASAGEYALFSLVANGAGLIEVVIMEIVANARYLLMSCAFSQKLEEEVSYSERLLLGFSITDEMFGATIMKDGKVQPAFCYGMMSIAIPGWAAGTMLGVVVGNALPENLVTALSVSLYGMFIATVVPATKKNKILLGVVILSMISSFALSTLSMFSSISSGFRIIILTVIISAVAALVFPIKENEG